ncbi:MAG TPA: protease inhibitor I42 family protein [Anaerolineales bacterium]
MKKIFLLTIMALLLGACSRSTKPSDPQITIETSPGKEFKVVIAANPTTGYHWEIVGDLDKTVVEFVSRDYKADTPQTTGSGGADTWVFKAVGAGDTQITLGYYPPSNNPVEPERTEIFKVSVK